MSQRNMISRNNLLILPLIFFFDLSCKSQIPGLKEDTRNAIIENTGKLLQENYVFPDTGLKMSNYLLTRKKAGEYKKVTDPILLGDILTRDIHFIYPDKHLYVEYNPIVEQEIINSNQEGKSSEDPFKKVKGENFGLKKVEVLSGNIGYVNLERFWADPKYGKEIVKSAFVLLKYTHAIIIDLRNNGGGSPESVSLICSFFFAQKLHMNSMYDRTENSTTEFWTFPDSTQTELWDKPLYILTSNKTFSAAEEFAYNMQSRKRALVIGETTGGGAHNTLTAFAGYGFLIHIPYGRAINPITNKNWEGTGVIPDFVTSSSEAMEFAEMKIFEELIKKTNDSSELFKLKWDYDLLHTINHPFRLSDETLRNYEGIYGKRVISYENGTLFYKRADKPKFELEAMSEFLMKPKNNNYFKVEFIPGTDGKIQKIRVHYQDKRIEEASRS